jgi:hypothetical protein
MEFNIKIKEENFLIKEGTILSFTKHDNNKYTICNIRKNKILSRYSGFTFCLRRITDNMNYGNYTEENVTEWLSSNGQITNL